VKYNYQLILDQQELAVNSPLGLIFFISSTETKNALPLLNQSIIFRAQILARAIFSFG